MSAAATETAMTIGAAVEAAAARLDASGIADARREARLILALALSVDPSVVLGYPERAIEAAAQARLAQLLARRVRREPFSRLKGAREFWSLDFTLSPDTLDPRPDSETLIEAALEFLPDRSAPLHLLDLGTGTGCLLLALLSELPRATGFGVDILAGAVETARRNACALGLDGHAQFVCGDWDQGIEGGVDVILANPPYIPSQEIALLAPEVAMFEPRQALDGGMDGLDAYRVLAAVVMRRLTPGGLACIEIGSNQGNAVVQLMTRSGLTVKAVRRDLSGHERCVVVTL